MQIYFVEQIAKGDEGVLLFILYFNTIHRKDLRNPFIFLCFYFYQGVVKYIKKINLQ